jgi:hypothetical protein
MFILFGRVVRVVVVKVVPFIIVIALIRMHNIRISMNPY